jgi:2-methylcitrate dehydratase PrpD
MHPTEITREIAEWTVSTETSSIPERVLEKARYQAASVLASVIAGRATRGASAAAALTGEGRSVASLLRGGLETRVEDTVLAGAAASMAHDFDDYLVFGHTGHSAVLVPLLLARETGASGAEVLAAQVVANEVAGRLGAAMVLGPHNGQMWAPIHALGAACAASRLLGLDRARTASAIGISLSLPPFAVTAGFMGPDSKLLTAAWPAVQGIVAARLARAGMKGASEILAGPRGMLAETCHAPIPAFFSGFGQAWVTDTLAYKIYPGCAYVDAAVDGALDILARVGAPGGIDPDRIGAIDVRATALTIGMQGLAGEGPVGPVRVNFSVPLSVAIALLRGRLGAQDLDDAALAAEGGRIEALAARVSVRHDWERTIALLRAIDRSLRLGALLGTVDKAALVRAGEEMVRRTGFRIGVPAPLPGLLFAAGGLVAEAAQRAVGGGTQGYDLGQSDLSTFTFPIGAEVRIRIDGREERATVDRPKGTPGDFAESFRLVEAKLVEEAARSGHEREGRELMDKLRRFEEHSPAELLESVGEIAE